MQSDSPSTPENVQPVSPAPSEKKNPIAILGTTVGVAILCVLLAAVAGVGYWAYTLNTNLTSTRQQLASLQSNYDQLKSENASLTTDLSAAKTDLQKAKDELATTQDNLKREQEKSKTLQAKVDKAKKYVDVMYGAWVENDSFSQTESKIKATNDTNLINKFETYLNAKNTANFDAWFDYYFIALADSLK